LILCHSNLSRAISLALGVPAVAIGAACGGNVSSVSTDAATGEGSSKDAAIDASSPDGATMEHDSGQADAGPIPDAADGATVDAGSLVTVTVIGPAGPEPNLPIVADDSNGAYLATYSTGPSGTFRGSLPPFSIVTVQLGPLAYSSLQTIVGVQPGDVIAFVDPGSLPAENISVPSVPMPLPSGTSQYALTVGWCKERFQGAPWAYYVESGCEPALESGGRVGYPAPLLVQALDSNGDPLGFVAQKDFDVPAEGDGGIVSIDLAGPWQTPIADVTEVSHAPSGIWASTIAEVVGGMLIGPGIQWISTGVIPPTDAGADDAGVDNVYSVHPGFADSLQGDVTWTSSMSGNVVVAVATNVPVPTSSPASLNIDATSIEDFPQVTGLATTGVAGGGLRIAWTAGALDTVTGVVGVASWLSANEQSIGTWTIISPSTAQMFMQSPALGPQASWGPQAGATFYSPWLYAFRGTAFPTYQRVRQSPSFFTESLSPTSFGCIGAFITDLVGPTIPPIPVGTSLTLGVYGQPPLPIGCD
jgi:hypothetical protein